MAGSPASNMYRADIDGLRALAVLAVIVFHVNADLLPGGFVGVDMFFVISGFLITGIIAKGIESNSFSFSEFFTRRIKRILPAYILVASATLLVASYLLIPNDYIFYTTSLAASWGFAANIFFSMLSWGYFGQRTEEFPLLHTWSLSVEEQFYFIFPVVLLILYRYLRKQILSILFILVVAFAFISEMKSGEARSYFLLTSRAHELLLGALTFFLARKGSLESRLISNVLAISGLVMMFGSMFFLNKFSAFPGLNSLFPCLGTAFLICAGRNSHVFTPLLKNRAMVFVGLISYSLYLWHWPILSFLRYRSIEMSLSVSLAAVTLTFVFAVLTWKFVESPIRHSKKIGFKKAAMRIYALPAAAFMAVGLYSYVTEGAPNRFSGEIRELIASYSFERDLGRTCAIRPEDYRKIDAAYLEQHCAFGETRQASAQVLLMGDSHAHHFKPFVEQLSLNAGLRAVYHVQGTCPVTYLPSDAQDDGAEPNACQKRNADLLSLAGKYRYVVFAGFWASEPTLDNMEADLSAVVETVLRAGATPVVFKDNAYFEPDLSQCILRKRRGWIPEDRNCNIPYEFVEKTQGPVDAIIDNIKRRYPEVVVIDPKEVMCNAKACLTYIGNTALYKDANHINAKAAKLLAEQYLSKVGNPFLASPPAYWDNGGL